jgi:hypothetical protein
VGQSPSVETLSSSFLFILLDFPVFLQEFLNFGWGKVSAYILGFDDSAIVWKAVAIVLDIP